MTYTFKAALLLAFAGFNMLSAGQTEDRKNETQITLTAPVKIGQDLLAGDEGESTALPEIDDDARQQSVQSEDGDEASLSPTDVEDPDDGSACEADEDGSEAPEPEIGPF